MGASVYIHYATTIMESLPSVSPSMFIVLPSNNSPLQLLRMKTQQRSQLRSRCPRISVYPLSAAPLFIEPSSSSSSNGSASRRRLPRETSALCRACSGGSAREEDAEEEEDLERALHMDGRIPRSSDQFVKKVSSRAYDMRRHLQQSMDCSSYDVLETNPWREASKPVYVLTQRENQLCTMKTRRSRREVERELGLLFSKGGTWRSEIGNKSKQSRSSTNFRMLVEDVREGVLVFEDEQDAMRYCDLLQGGSQGCEGVAELEASWVFDICYKMRALAVLFRRGMTPPLPESLKLNLKARKRSLEDQDLI
ncbi:hypothetical protein CKAN_02236100 [Cinnamomum micranthum f. kanehirae]|uniref:Uncharacterized protein n=1 Tax=Cinnamomum micranthum f. kanehirae TaxID=337451 RepID=A0A3S3P4F4_9MAGN|nr:hypothetical protein CKAN_02236100 [Cinnamomum micranthum f. kanehirae]